MDAYQQRVLEEKAELDKKLNALNTFLQSDKVRSVPVSEHTRLVRQSRYMESYSGVLAERIAEWSND